MFDVITIGETMILMEPDEDGPLKYVTTFKKKFGGAESNVAIGLARLGSKVGWVSGIHEDSLGDFLISGIRGEGIDTSRIVYKENTENALYIKERTRAGINHVYYYRSDSAASALTFDDLDLTYLAQTKVIHLTGITPFLSENCLDLTRKVMQFAKKNNIFISFDPNLRHKLMARRSDATEIILELCEKVDLLLPGLDEARFLTGLTEVSDIIDYFKLTGVKNIVLKDGENGSYYSDVENQFGKVDSFNVERVIDPIGAGDGFAAGVINGLLKGLSLREAVKQGSLIGSLVVQVKGDVEGLPSIRVIENLQNGFNDVTR